MEGGQGTARAHGETKSIESGAREPDIYLNTTTLGINTAL